MKGLNQLIHASSAFFTIGTHHTTNMKLYKFYVEYKNSKMTLYNLIDCFSLFYLSMGLHFMLGQSVSQYCKKKTIFYATCIVMLKETDLE